MRIPYCFPLLFFLITSATAQSPIEKSLKKFNNESVPYIYIDELDLSKVAVLDSRKREEYDVSHLKDAIWIGHKEFSIDSVAKFIPDKSNPIVVYCSIGVRSEKVGEQLIKAGYTNVKNLYGGIFEWKNKGFEVYNSKGRQTDSVHAFSKKWGQLLTKGTKVYNE